MSNDLLEGQSIADMLSRWYEGGTREQMCDEAFAQIRKLERELAAVRHDLERATANHSADLNDKRLPESGMALSMRASLTRGEATVRDLRALSHILAGSDDRELVQHAADLIEVLAKPTAPSASDARDAERYRFMRRFDRFALVHLLLDKEEITTLDQAVDRAMADYARSDRGANG